MIGAGRIPASQGGTIALQWWAADGLGVLVLSPLLLAAVRMWAAGRPSLRPQFLPMAACYLAGVSALCYLVFFHAAAFYLLFAVFLLILIAAAWLGAAAARATAFIVAIEAVRATGSGVGAFSGGTLQENLQNLALFLIAVALTGLAVGAFRAIGNLAMPGGILLAGWALSGWLYASMDADRSRYDAARLDQVITSVESRIQSRSKTYEDVLWGASGLLATQDRISPQRWQTYVKRLRLFDRYPETTAISIVESVPNAELESFVDAHRKSGWPDFAAHRVNGTEHTDDFPEHFLVVCTEPASVAARAVGADLAGDAVRRTAAEQARDRGQAFLTRSMVLGDGGKGLQLFVPVYRENAPVNTTEERRQALRAWVTVTFRSDTFFRTALAELQSIIGLRVSDSERGGDGSPFFAAGREPGLPPTERTTQMTLDGTSWTLRWNRLPTFPHPSRAPIGWAAGCTALLSLVMAGLVLILQATKRKTSDRLKVIQSASSLGTWELEVRSGTVQCSHQLLLLYGSRELRDRLSLDEWLGYVHPDDRESMAAEIGGLHGNRETIDRQYRVVWPDGSTHWLHSRALRLFDEQGRPSRVVGVDFDISEIKELQSQLAQAQKLESVGQLATGVAHEINTPIQYIGDNGKFLQDAFRDLIQVSSGPKTQENEAAEVDEGLIDYLKVEVPKAIEQLLEGVDQVARIVRAMKEFSHPGPIEKAAIDLNRAIDSTLLVSRNEWKYVADVTTDFAVDLPLVPCVAGEFNQVILNLVVNAAHAIGDVVKDTGRKGTIHVSTRLKDGTVEVSISDTGGGIPDAIQSKVFDPFFTTKPVGKGTGQGLAIARSVIVNKHNGTITLDSEPGRGTTFTIQLPLACEVEMV
jgi:PAS domain S-box-containing protein